MPHLQQLLRKDSDQKNLAQKHTWAEGNVNSLNSKGPPRSGVPGGTSTAGPHHNHSTERAVTLSKEQGKTPKTRWPLGNLGKYYVKLRNKRGRLTKSWGRGSNKRVV